MRRHETTARTSRDSPTRSPGVESWSGRSGRSDRSLPVHRSRWGIESLRIPDVDRHWNAVETHHLREGESVAPGHEQQVAIPAGVDRYLLRHQGAERQPSTPLPVQFPPRETPPDPHDSGQSVEFSTVDPGLRNRRTVVPECRLRVVDSLGHPLDEVQVVSIAAVDDRRPQPSWCGVSTKRFAR